MIRSSKHVPSRPSSPERAEPPRREERGYRPQGQEVDLSRVKPPQQGTGAAKPKNVGA